MEYIKTTKLINIGDSRGIVIPKSILDALHLQRGDQVVFGITNETTLQIHKLSREELLALNTQKN